MSKKLLLLRHAEAQKHSDTSDHDRELTDLGEAEAHIIGEYIKTNNIPVDLILSSDAKRALSTSLIAAVAMGKDPNILYTIPDLYKASPLELVKLISTIRDHNKSVMIVGHNPTITSVHTELLIKNHQLLTKALNYDITAKLVIIESAAKTWAEFPKTECAIVDVVYPEIH